MDMVFKEYGYYIIATISVALVIGAACMVFGIYDSGWLDIAQVRTEGVVVKQLDNCGNGIFGRMVWLWLNMSM